MCVFKDTLFLCKIKYMKIKQLKHLEKIQKEVEILTPDRARVFYNKSNVYIPLFKSNPNYNSSLDSLNKYKSIWSEVYDKCLIYAKTLNIKIEKITFDKDYVCLIDLGNNLIDKIDYRFFTLGEHEMKRELDLFKFRLILSKYKNC